VTCLHVTRHGGQGGFTLAELLIALTITLLIAGAIAKAAPAARAAFDRLPAELEMQQRGRMAIDSLSQALRSADRVSVANPDESGAYAELTVVTPVASGAQAVLSIDQAAPAAMMTLAASACPNIRDVCGFIAGSLGVVSDNSGYDVFIVSSTDAGQRRLTPDHALSRAYPAGAHLVEVEENSFGLDQQSDGTYSLTRVTAAGAVQPIADFIASLTFNLVDRQVAITLHVQAAQESLRPLISDRVFKTSITARNVHE
jgi:prepilin-type N-terminal cleavage/methylation domain-containing protein